MKHRETLKHKEVYVYDKNHGFQLYNPLSYEYNGYTIDKLYELMEHYKNKVQEYENAFEDVKHFMIEEDIKIGKESLYELTKTLNSYHLTHDVKNLNAFHVDGDGYIVKHTKFSPYDVFIRGVVDTPTDLEKGVYRFKKGQITKDEAKEAELWKVY